MKRIACLGLLTGSGSASLEGLSDEQMQHVETPWGSPSGPLRSARFGDLRVLALARHGVPHRLAPHLINYRANVWTLQVGGAEAVVAVNAVGGISREMSTGSLVLPDQLIDYTWGRADTFFDGTQMPLKHVDLSFPFDRELGEALSEAAERVGETLLQPAVCAVTQGPRLETAAEVERLSRDGCDIVGMTSMPEAALAAELDLPYAMLGLVVNPAAGRDPQGVDVAAIDIALEQGMGRIERLLRELFGLLA